MKTNAGGGSATSPTDPQAPPTGTSRRLSRHAASVALDASLLVATFMAATTDHIVLWFHTTFALLTISSLFLDFRAMARRALVWVPVTVTIVVIAIGDDRTQSDELGELPLLTASLAAVLIASHWRTTTLADWRRAQVALEDHQDIEHDRLEHLLAQSQAADAVGRLATGVAHDFSNVLSAIVGHAEDLADMLEDETAQTHAEAIEIAVHRAIALVDELMSLGRGLDDRPVDVLDLNDVVVAVIAMLQPLIGDDIHVRTVISEAPCTARSTESRLERVVVNLVLNAREAMATGGELVVSTDLAAVDVADGELSPGRYAVLTVSDEGCGIDPERIEHVFEPFFTTKGRAGGTGVGLSTVREIVRHGGGTVRLESTMTGTTARVLLPFVEGASTRNDELDDGGPTKLGTELVLLVEDDDHVRHRLRSVLEHNGYAVLDTATAEDALELFATDAGTIDLILSDVVLPGMNGPQLIHELRATRPGIKALLMSRYSDASSLGLSNVQTARFLRKPIRRQELLAEVRQLLDD